MAVLAPLLVLAGLELARAARYTAAPGNWTVPLLTAACVLGGNTGLGALAGCTASATEALWGRRGSDAREHQTGPDPR